MTIHNDGTHVLTSGQANLPEFDLSSSVLFAASLGNVTISKQTDPLGCTTLRFSAAAGRLTAVYLPEVADALNGNAMTRPHWQYAYDGNGNQFSQTDPMGHVTSFTYDEFGRRLSRMLPLNQTETSSYDSYGRLSQSIDFKGNTTFYVYFDTGVNAGRVQYKRYFTPGQALNTTPNQEVEYHYDSLGRTDTVTERSGGATVQVTTYGYDPITGGVVLESLYDSASSNYAKIMRHEYDPATGRLLATWTASTTSSATNLTDARTGAITLTEYAYDTFGRLQTTTLKRVNSTSVTKTTTNSYDAVGNLDTVTQPNGVVTDYDYDGLNRLNHETVKKSNGNKLFEQTYTLLDDGQRDYVIEKRYDGNGNGNSNVFSNVKIDWSYDALNRLAGETWDADTTPGNGSDNFGTQEGSDYTDTYSFDLAGNRILKTHTVSGTTTTIRSGYNANDQLLWVSNNGDDDSNGVYEPGDVQYGYDANGSTTQVTTTTSGGSAVVNEVWDVRNRLVQYDADGSGTVTNGDASYTYTDAGHRISKTIVGTGTTYNVIDDSNPTGYSQVLEERSTLNGTPVATYFLAMDVAAQVDASSTFSYFGCDGRGSTRLMTDANGAQVTNSGLDYDAFGNQIAGSTTITSLRFDGEYWDAEKGSYNLRGRVDYTPLIGRFGSRDPMAFGVGELLNANSFVFGSGNPVFYSDPSGNMSIVELGLSSFIQNTIMGIELSVLAGFYVSFLGGRRGESTDEIALQFALDQTLGQFDPSSDLLMGTIQDLLGSFERGNVLIGEADRFSMVPVWMANPAQLASRVIIGRFKDLERTGRGVYDRDHLNQTAAWNEQLSTRNDGLAFLNQADSHVRRHQYMNENLWREYRGTDNRPSVREYNRVSYESFLHVGYSKREAIILMRAMKAEQLANGFRASDFVPRVPKS